VSDNLDPERPGITATVQHRSDAIVLRLDWRNYRVRRDNLLVTFYFVFWLAFAAAALWATYCVLFARPQNNTVLPDWVGWVCFGTWLIVAWAVTIGVPYSLLGLCWSEWIEISEQAFSCGASGFLAPKPTTLALGEVCELFLGHCGESSELESFLTLNVLSSRGRIRWGEWLAPTLKVRAFKMIEEFVRLNGIPMRMRLGDNELRRSGSSGGGRDSAPEAGWAEPS
jgi:hypothetical protein